jgi:N-acetylneuraminate lyase
MGGYPLFSGVFPALLTPLTDQDGVDTAALCELTEFLLSRGVNGFYLCGSTGEGLLLTEQERCLVAETVVRQVRGRAPVVAHVGALATSVAERLAGHAREAGADAVASIPPFYYAVGRAGIEAHYRRIAQAAGLPLYLYNIPVATQVSLDVHLIRELLHDGVICGLKYTSYDQLGFREIVELCGDGLNLLAGPDEMLLPFLLMGAHGGIGTTYNLVPELFVELYAAWAASDVQKAKQVQYQIDRIILAIRSYGVVPAVKAAMRLRGIDCGGPRMPLVPLTAEQMEQLKCDLDAVGFSALEMV